MDPSLRYWGAIGLIVIALVVIVTAAANGERSPWLYVTMSLLMVAMLASLFEMKHKSEN